MPDWLVSIIVGAIVIFMIVGFLWSLWRFIDYMRAADEQRQRREFNRRHRKGKK